jgi:hypothetical protein
MYIGVSYLCIMGAHTVSLAVDCGKGVVYDNTSLSYACALYTVAYFLFPLETVQSLKKCNIVHNKASQAVVLTYTALVSSEWFSNVCFKSHVKLFTVIS